MSNNNISGPSRRRSPPSLPGSKRLGDYLERRYKRADGDRCQCSHLGEFHNFIFLDKDYAFAGPRRRPGETLEDNLVIEICDSEGINPIDYRKDATRFEQLECRCREFRPFKKTIEVMQDTYDELTKIIAERGGSETIDDIIMERIDAYYRKIREERRGR
jgi:hypothetical protein